MPIREFAGYRDYCGSQPAGDLAGTITVYPRMNATCLRHDVVSYAIQNPLG